MENFTDEKLVENEAYGNKIIIFPNNASEKQTSYPKGTVLQRLSQKEKEKISRPLIINQSRRLIKRKAVTDLLQISILHNTNFLFQESPTVTHRQIIQNLPENPDAKLIRMLKSDTEDDFDDEEEMEDMEDTLPPSRELLRELKAELKFQENRMIQDKQKQAEDNFNPQSKLISLVKIF